MDLTEHYPDTSTSVALACRSGNIETLKELIRQGKSVESVDNRGWRPIHEAACWNHADCIKFLVNNGEQSLMSSIILASKRAWVFYRWGSAE